MKKSIKILAIGNSFSIDAMEYLWHILRAGGVEEIILGDLFIGGCPVSLHAQNIKDDAHTYIYLKNTDGVWHQTPEASLTDGLLDEEWDIVTLQQASHDSGLPETYAPQDEVLDYIKANRPHARIYWHMTWAYQSDSDHGAFPRYGCDQAVMYHAILNAVKTEVLTRPAYAGILPVGTVIQNLRATPLGDTLNEYNQGGMDAELLTPCLKSKILRYKSIQKQTDDFAFIICNGEVLAFLIYFPYKNKKYVELCRYMWYNIKNRRYYHGYFMATKRIL